MGKSVNCVWLMSDMFFMKNTYTKLLIITVYPVYRIIYT